MRSLFRLEPHLSLALTSHTVTIPSRLVPVTQRFTYAPIHQIPVRKSVMLIFNHSGKRSSRASPLYNPTFLRHPPIAPIMAETNARSILEGIKNKFWHERRHLQQDEIRLQWAAEAATYASILFDTDDKTVLPETTRIPTPRPWAEASARRRGSVCALLNLLSSPIERADDSTGCRHFWRTRRAILRCSCVAADV